MRGTSALMVLLLLTATGGGETWAADRIFAVEHDRHIFYQKTNLQAGTYEVRASADLPSTDTVAHVWEISPTNSWVGSNDDSFTSNCANPPLIPDGGSCHSFTLAQPASIVFFVHRRHNSASGDTTIELEDMGSTTTIWSLQASVGGEVIDSGPSGADVEWDDRETLHAAVTEALPGPTPDDDWVGGMLAPVMLVLAGPERLVGYGVGSPLAIAQIGTQGPVIGGQPSVYLPVGSDAIPVEPVGGKHQFVIGTDYWVDFQVTPWILGNGTLDLYLNDASKGAAHDEDNDGLGDLLEQAIGTCWEVAPGCAIPRTPTGTGCGTTGRPSVDARSSGATCRRPTRSTSRMVAQILS